MGSTAIHTKTKEEFNRVLEIFNNKGWNWFTGSRPTFESDNWNNYKEETIVEYADRFTFTKKGRGNFDEVISFEEFLRREEPGEEGHSKRFETARMIMESMVVGGMDSNIPDLIEKAYRIADELIKQENK